MRKDDLFIFLNTGLLTDHFSKELKEEVFSYRNGIQSKKDVKSIYGENDIEEPFSRQKLITLLEFYLQHKILEWDLEYILNYIELSFEFTEVKVEEVVFSLSDPYLNFPINTENVKEALLFLKDTIDSMNLKDDKKMELRGNFKSIFSELPLRF